MTKKAQLRTIAKAAMWTDERKERQRELIRTWRPWEKSTGPRTEAGKRISSQNATDRWLQEVKRRVHGCITGGA